MHQITPQVTKLYNALMERKIKCELECYDGHKHIDISIPWAKIDIEVDGLHHYINPDQILSDFQRSYWSITRDDYDTFHVPNIIVDQHLEKVADAIAVIARSHYEAIKEEKKHPLIHWLSLFVKKIKG